MTGIYICESPPQTRSKTIIWGTVQGTWCQQEVLVILQRFLHFQEAEESAILALSK